MKRIAILVACLFVVMAASAALEAGKKKDQPYAGLQKCAMCHKGMHAAMWTKWEGTKHAHSYKDMVEKYPAAAKDKQCLKCHTTGFGEGGFDPAKKNEADFGGITCEGCHGPMGDHAGNPGDPKLKKTKIRCHECHFGPPEAGIHKHKVQLHGKKG